MTALSERATATVDGRAMTWHEAGRGPTILLLHDICANATSWRAQFGDLTKDHRVIALDCPGFGGTALLPQREPAADDYAEAVAQFCEHLKLDRVTMVGSGMGAVLAAAFAAKHPKSVASLALVGAQARIGGAEAGRMLSWLQDLVRDPAAFGVGYADKVLPQKCERPVREAVAAMAATLSPIGFGRACQMMAGADLAARLKGLRLPMLLIYGDLDKIAPPECGTVLDTIVRGTITEILPDAGHAPQLETPAAFNRALRVFIRAARPRT